MLKTTIVMLMCFGVATAVAKNKVRQVQPQTAKMIDVGPVYQESIDPSGTNEYSFIPAVTGLHTLTIRGANTDMSGWIYNDEKGFDFNCDQYLDNNDEMCSVELEAGVEYMMDIDEWSDVPANFELSVIQN